VGDTPRTHALLPTHRPYRITPSQTILQLRYQVSVDSTLYLTFCNVSRETLRVSGISPANNKVMWRNRPNLFLFQRFPFVILQQPLASPHRLRLHHFATWTGNVHESGVSRETTPALHTHQTYVSHETTPTLRTHQTFHVKHQPSQQLIGEKGQHTPKSSQTTQTPTHPCSTWNDKTKNTMFHVKQS